MKELDEYSSYLITFKTEFGHFGFTRMPFRVNVAGGVFQHKLDEIFGKLSQVMCIADVTMAVGYKKDHRMTEFGHFRFTRMPFRVNVAGDVFQHNLDEIFGKLSQVMCIADDIMAVGYKKDHRMTEFGHFRFTRMPFRVNVVGDVFQHKLDEIFGKLSQVMCIADDIMVVGNKEDHSKHDVILTKLYHTAQKNNVKLNFKKHKCMKHEVTFLRRTKKHK